MTINKKPFVNFATDPEHYSADACVVWCYDDRFFKLLKAFGKQEGFEHIDLVKVAGGAKALAGDASPERDFILDQIKKSAALHGTKRVMLMLHRDCGAYGGSKHFADADAETAFFAGQLTAASDWVKQQLPDLEVRAYFGDFDGLHAAE